MNELIEFLTSKEIIVVYIVAAVACLLCFVIYLIDKNYYKRKQRHNTKELNKLVEEVNEIIETEYEETTPVEVFDTPVLETIEPTTYTAKVNEMTEEIVEETPVVENIKVEEVVEPIIEKVEEPVVEEFIEQLEDEEVEPINVEEIVLETMTEEPVVEEIKTEEPVVEEELTYTTIEPDRQQAQEELIRLTQELEKAEQEQKNIDLTAYEEEQEENAIISLDELVKKSKEMYEANEITQYADEGNEPISLEDLERRMNKVQEEVAAMETIEEPISLDAIPTYDEPVITESFDLNAIIPSLEALTETEETPQQMVLDDFNSIKVEPEIVEEVKPEPVRPAYQATKKFERSPVISPIYGIERKETKEEIELENTANYEKLDEEIKKTNEFLMTLRELQKNLD